jgi:hypothetical protein
MDLDPQTAAEIARNYFTAPNPLKRLGWGIGGYVYLSPDTLTAVKVHRREEGFQTELEAYWRLRKLGMTKLHGLNIPRLLSHSPELKLIQMDVVTTPFLLDFAGVLFRPPDFTDDAMQHWTAAIEGWYGPNAWFAHMVHHSLARHGMYYVDFRPTNMKLDGHPDLQPFDASAADD